MTVNEYKEVLSRGQKGLNMGVPFGLPKLERFVPGILRAKYYLIAGLSGSGKTSFVLDKFYIPLVEQAIGAGKDVHFLFFNFEMPEQSLITKIVQRQMALNQKVELEHDYILSMNKKLSPVDRMKVEKELDFWDECEKRTSFVSMPLSPKAIRAAINRWAANFGKFDLKNKFTPYNKDVHLVIMLDHFGLIALDKYTPTITSAIETVSSQVLLPARNNLNATIVALQQFGNDLQSTERKRYGVLMPSANDLRDSKRTQHDCDYSLGIHSPLLLHQEQFMGYDISSLRDNFRAAVLMKARFSTPESFVPLIFKGKVNTFYEAPMPDDNAGMQKLYLDLKIVDNHANPFQSF